MRNKLRIPIVLDKIIITSILQSFLNTEDFLITDKIYKNWNLIKKEWNSNPDQRFGQLLSNLNLVTKEIENHIWNIEEDQWLVENNYIDHQNIMFWGVNFYKNGNRRKKIKFKLLKDLTDDHIENILKYFNKNYNLTRLNLKYLEYFITRVYA